LCIESVGWRDIAGNSIDALVDPLQGSYLGKGNVTIKLEDAM